MKFKLRDAAPKPEDEPVELWFQDVGGVAYLWARRGSKTLRMLALDESGITRYPLQSAELANMGFAVDSTGKLRIDE